MQSLKVYGDNAKLSRNTKNVLEDMELKILSLNPLIRVKG